MNRVCSIDGCGRQRKARGLCGAHYERLRNHGDPLGGGPTCYKTSEDRFDNSWEWSVGVVGEGVDTPCMIWTAATSNTGYGQLSVDGRMVRAHRYSYERFVGKIPDGLAIDHLCRVRSCVNPEHMDPVTSRENTMRGVGLAAVNAFKDHCPRGHELVEGNLEESHKARGWRKCLTCGRDRDRRRHALISAARAALGLTQREYIATHGYSAKVAEKVLREVAA